jgi:hypothetical protein
MKNILSCWVACAVLTACGGGVQRQACYASAEAAAWADAERSCKLDTQPWDECSERDRINADLAESYKRCP